MTFLNEKIRIMTELLSGRTIAERKAIEKISFAPCGYKTENRPPKDAEMKPCNNETLSLPVDGHGWFTFELDVPETTDQYEYFLSVINGKENDWDAVNPQYTVFIDDDTAYQGLDTHHHRTPLSAGHHVVNVYYYAGMTPNENGSVAIRTQFFLDKLDRETYGLYYDVLVPYEAMLELPEDSVDRYTLQNILSRAEMLIDFRHADDVEGFHRSVKEARAFLKTELYDKEFGSNGEELALFGHTHIDVAWLWTLAQTEEKAQRSFATVIRFMERFPEYQFMSSQPQLFWYIKKNDPKLYEKIKERVKEGRFEVEGAMWLEADTNLTSGEGLVRQILYGKKFMKDEFGIESNILWLPDVFGYSGALPQILKKSGVNRFFTCKLSWCETNKFPHDHFLWQGIDGSEIFATLSQSYVNTLDPKRIMSTCKEHIDKDYSSMTLSTFGYGDGGGGPTEDMLEQYRRLEKGIPGMPKVHIEYAGSAMTKIENNFRKNAKELRFTPRWKGELYFEMHRGTYTSMAHNKKCNRKSELLYQTLENAAVTAYTLGVKNDYPKELLDENWHTILKNQFHDILPGSSIREVYDVSAAEYEKVLNEGGEELDKTIAALAENIAESGTLVYNPSPFKASGVIETENGFRLVSDIPAHGYKVVSPEKKEQPGLSVDEYHIENRFVKVTFDKNYRISSVFDKVAKREVVEEGNPANALRVFEDFPRFYDAWEITEYYKQKYWEVDDVSEVSLIREGDRVGLKIRRTYQKSTITQEIVLYPHTARIDFKTEVDWHENQVLLKTFFPTTVHTMNARYEIQFGHLFRPTHYNTSWDEAKFEVCAHKWADISENGYGVSLLNDCKYGYSAEDNVLSLSLLKAACYPNPTADRGINTFTYSLYPHSGSFGVDTVREGYLLNMPPVTKNTCGKRTSVPTEFCFVSSSEEGFVTETIKRAEDGNGIIVRGYEAMDGKCSTELSFGIKIKKAYLCDLMENMLEELSVSENSRVKLDAKNFEILTLRVIPE